MLASQGLERRCICDLVPYGTLWLHCTPAPCLQMISQCFTSPLPTAYKVFSSLSHLRWAYQILLLSLEPLGSSVRLSFWCHQTLVGCVAPLYLSRPSQDQRKIFGAVLCLLLMNKSRSFLIKLTSAFTPKAGFFFYKIAAIYWL